MASYDVSLGNPKIFYPAAAVAAGAVIYGATRALKVCANGVQRCYRRYRPLPLPLVDLTQAIAAAARNEARLTYNRLGPGLDSREIGIAVGATATRVAQRANVNVAGIVAIASAEAGRAAGEASLAAGNARLAAGEAAAAAAILAAQANGGNPSQIAAAGAAAKVLMAGEVGVVFDNTAVGETIRKGAAIRAAVLIVIQRAIAQKLPLNQIIDIARDTVRVTALALEISEAELHTYEAAATADAIDRHTIATAERPLDPVHFRPAFDTAAATHATALATTADRNQVAAAAGAAAAHHTFDHFHVNIAGTAAIAGYAAARSAMTNPAVPDGVDAIGTIAASAASNAARLYGATVEDAAKAGAIAGAAARAYVAEARPNFKPWSAAKAAGAAAATHAMTHGGDAVVAAQSAARDAAIAAGANVQRADIVSLEARDDAIAAINRTAALAAGARAVALPLVGPSWMGRAITYVGAKARELLPSNTDKGIAATTVIGALAAGFLMSTGAGALALATGAAIEVGKHYFETHPVQADQAKAFLNKALPTHVDKGIAAGTALSALGTAAFVSTGAGIGVAVTGAAIVAGKQYLDRSAAQVEAAQAAAAGRIVPFTDLERDPTLNQFSIGKPTLMEDDLSKPILIPTMPYLIQPPLGAPLGAGTGIVASVLQALADPYFMGALPNAIRKRLCESELFPSGVVVAFKNTLDESGNSSLTAQQQAALLQIGTILRKSTPIDANELDSLRQHLQVLGRGDLPVGFSRKRIDELSVLLELRQCYTDPNIIPEGQVVNLYEALLRMNPSDRDHPGGFLRREMSQNRPYDILRSLTHLLEESPGQVQYVPELTKKPNQFSSEAAAPERLIRVIPIGRGSEIGSLSATRKITNLDGSHTTYTLNAVINWAQPEKGAGGTAAAAVVRNPSRKGWFGGGRETWYINDTTNASQNRKVVRGGELPLQTTHLLVTRKDNN